jgi:chitodextrinase
MFKIKHFSIPILSGLFLLLPVFFVQAAPAVSGVSGTLSKGNTVTISGSGFGVKATAKPIIWADFSTDINPSSLGQKTTWDGNDNLARTTSLPAGAGNSNGAVGTWTSGKQSFSFMTSQPVWSKIYVYAKRYYDFDETGNQKFFRLWNSGTTGPNDFIDIYGGAGNGARVYNEADTGNPNRYQGADYVKNTWLQEEFIWQYSGGSGKNGDGSAGNGSGIFDYTRNGVDQQHTENNNNGANTQAELRVLDNYTDSAYLPPNGSNVYMTNMYVDNTYSRVMLGNASTLAASTHREIQIPQTWSDGSVSAVINQGTFNNGDTAYIFVVDANNNAGPGYQITIGGGSSDIQAPTVPTGLIATAVSPSQINLSWNVSTDNVGVTGYRIYRDGSLLTTTASNNYSSTGLSASTLYSYTVSAYDAASNFSAQSGSASATTLNPPDISAPTVPVNLSATAVSPSQINLSWNVSTDNVGVTGYRIYRAGVQIATSSSNSFNNIDLFSSTQYFYTVSAYDAASNFSAQSFAAVATTQASADVSLPKVPSGLSATAISSSQINLSWNASTDADGVSAYRVYRNGAVVATSTLTSYSDVGLSASTQYSYTVSAGDPAHNFSAQSSAVSVTTPAVVSSGGGGSSGGSSGGGGGSSGSATIPVTPVVSPVTTPISTSTKVIQPTTVPTNNNPETNTETTSISTSASLAGASSAVVNNVTASEAAVIISQTAYVNFSSGAKISYDKLVAQSVPISTNQKENIANFIQSGTPTTIVLGAGERAGSINSFNSAFSRLPNSALDWQDVVKIGNGRWTTQTSPTAEARAKISFKQVYLRTPNMTNAKDNAAVNIMAYGLRPAQRNTASEKTAILSFKYIYEKMPVSASDWDIVRAIAYSGAKR